ncbi:hypothetical protein GCM10007092_07570 [Thermus composti]|uniref:DUF3311 domain-containing protein n=1 Tax=Thermus composti TaxID=532059 RepID=A0ABV6Q141_9DEIN|nr:hypothetical protein [Thermus composti]GGM96442.1 hypothetical protein GCM10007092_07570 [Thermus composti]
MKARAFSLFLLGFGLFTLPLDLFPKEPVAWGFPPLYLYLYGAWGLVILLAHRLGRRP